MTERWKPESGEWYWYVGSDIVPYEDQWENFYLDGDYYESGNCFRTEEETKAAAEKVKALLLSLHEPEDGNSQKTPISESLQQEDCKKRTFVRPSHTTPEHYKPDPKTGEWWRSKGDDRYMVKVVDGDYQLFGRRIVKYENSRNITMAANIEDFLERFEKEDGPVLTLGDDAELIKPSHETPEHYKLDPEPIVVIKAWDLGFCLGNVIKYIARAGHKAGESRDSDLHKAMEYLRMELEDQANEVYEAYKKKNAVNRQRIEEGY